MGMSRDLYALLWTCDVWYVPKKSDLKISSFKYRNHIWLCHVTYMPFYGHVAQGLCLRNRRPEDLFLLHYVT